MKDQLSMFGPVNLPDTPSVISSLAAGSGVTRSGKRAGQTIGPSTLAAAPVHPSLRRAKARGLMTLVTSGLYGIPSSASAGLQSSLENNLQRQLDSAGSTLFVETWKRRATPLRRRYWEHTASARRTSGGDCTSLPTPTTHDVTTRGNSEADNHYYPHDLSNAAMLAATSTPQAADASGGGQAKRALRSQRENGVAQSANLNDYAMLAAVPTPMAGSPATETYNAAGNTDYSRRIVELAMVRTPSTSDAERGAHPNPDAKAGQHSLVTEVKLSSVPTPDCNPDLPNSSTNRGSDYGGERRRLTLCGLGPVAQLTTVATPRAEDSESPGRHRGNADGLCSQTQLSAVPTPNTRDFKSASASAEFLAEQQAQVRGQNLSVDVQLSTVATPKASDGDGGRTVKTPGGNSHLQIEARLSTVATPTCPAPHDSDQTAGRSRPRNGYGQDPSIQASLCVPGAAQGGSTPSTPSPQPLQEQPAVSGLTATGGTEPTKSSGQLNPEYSLWLQGIPVEWVSFGSLATASASRSRSSSLKPTLKPEPASKPKKAGKV